MCRLALQQRCLCVRVAVWGADCGEMCGCNSKQVLCTTTVVIMIDLTRLLHPMDVWCLRREVHAAGMQVLYDVPIARPSDMHLRYCSHIPLQAAHMHPKAGRQLRMCDLVEGALMRDLCKEMYD